MVPYIIGAHQGSTYIASGSPKKHRIMAETKKRSYSVGSQDGAAAQSRPRAFSTRSRSRSRADSYIPKPLFCELEVLRYSQKDGTHWKEIARLIRYEEHVEEESGRWSKPHVASLTVPHVQILREQLEQGLVIFDATPLDLPELSDSLVHAMAGCDHVPDKVIPRIKEFLTATTKHQKSSVKPVSALKTTMQQKNLRRRLDDAADMGPITDEGEFRQIDPEVPQSPGSSEKKPGGNFDLLRHIPNDTLAANLLVGELEEITAPITILVRLLDPVILGDMTEIQLPTKILFIHFQPAGKEQDAIEVGRCMGAMLADESFRTRVFTASEVGQLIRGVDVFTERAVLLPRSEWDPSIRLDPPMKVPPQAEAVAEMAEKAALEIEEKKEEDDPLRRTGRPFGGMVLDIKRKIKFYKSDFTDAIHIQTVAATLFMYIAALTPIITFGGLLGKATDNYMAAMEGILSGAVCGVTFALFGGQPLIIVGSTGPVLVFEGIIYTFCKDFGWEFLPFRLWVGVWTGAFLLILTAFDLSFLIKYVTRFTEEGFATLISLIFIYEAIEKVLLINNTYGLNTNPNDLSSYSCMCVLTNSTNNVTTNFTATLLDEREQCRNMGGVLEGAYCNQAADVFLFSILVFLGTFVFSIFLKFIKNTPYFPSVVRSILSDFAVIISVALMTLTDFSVGLNTPKLKVPTEFKPTRADRGWVINPVSNQNPWWTYLVAAGPGIFLTILVFLDQQITAVIINRPDNKLKKGPGYHLDLFLISVQVIFCSFLGLPWFVAATVRSVAHTLALRTESEATAPGEKPEFLGIRENRVTGLLVSILIGVSVFMTGLFQRIPMCVLYGVFLYMGITSLRGVQLMDRLRLLFMPEKYQPDFSYLRLVRTWKVHVFTLVQLTCLIALWVVKAIKSISMFFPLMILALCVIRKLLELCYRPKELMALDDALPGRHLREKKKKVDEEAPKVLFVENGAASSTHREVYHNNVDTSDEMAPRERKIEFDTNTRL